MAAVEAALTQLAHEPGFAANRLVLWGTDGGASTALLAAARHPELVAVIAQNACYDPWAAYRALPAAEQAAYVLASGSDSAAWRARSPLAVATRITVPVLVLQTDEPGAPDAAAAQAFAESRADQKLFIEARISASEGHPFHKRDASRVAHDFLARRTR